MAYIGGQLPKVLDLTKGLGWKKTGAPTSDSAVDDLAAAAMEGFSFENTDPDSIFEPQKNLLVNANKSFRMDLGGALIRHLFDAQLFTITNPILGAYPITLIEPVTADFSAGTVATPSQVSRLTIGAATDAVPPGAYGKVISLDRNPNVRLADNARKGEPVRVRDSNNGEGTLTLYARLRDTYTVGNGLMFIHMDDSAVFNLRNGVFSNVDSEFRNGCLSLTSFIGPGSITGDNIRFLSTQSQAIRLVNCAYGAFTNIYGQDLFTGVNAESEVLNLNATGYLFAVVACTGIRLDGFDVTNGRHGFITSPAQVTPGNETRYELYGPTRDCIVTNGVGHNMQGSLLDGHDDSIGLHFSHCVATMAFNGPRNAALGASLRGKGHTAVDVHVIGGSGFRLFVDSADLQAGSDHGGHTLTACTHTPNPNETYETYSVRVSGNPVNPVLGNRVEGGVWSGAGREPGALPSVSYGSLETEGGKWSAPLSTSVVTAAALDVREGATLTMRRPAFDFSGLTGGRLSKWRSRDYNSYAELIATTEPTGTLRSVSSRDLGTHGSAIPNEGAYRSTGSGWERLRSAKSELYVVSPDITVPSGGTNGFASLVDVSGEQAIAHVVDARINRICAEAGGVSLQSNTPVAGSDIQVDYQVTGTPTLMPTLIKIAVPDAAVSSASGQVLPVAYRSQDELLWQLTSTVQNVIVNAIEKGVRHGQRGVILNANALRSRNIRILRSTTGLIDIAGELVSRTFADAVTTNTSPTLTSATAAFSASDVGAAITGAGIPTFTNIVSVQSATSVTLSKNATVTASGVSVTVKSTNGEILLPPRQLFPVKWNADLAVWTGA